MFAAARNVSPSNYFRGGTGVAAIWKEGTMEIPRVGGSNGGFACLHIAPFEVSHMHFAKFARHSHIWLVARRHF
jgi:hypothetical protein